MCAEAIVEFFLKTAAKILTEGDPQGLHRCGIVSMASLLQSALLDMQTVFYRLMVRLVKPLSRCALTSTFKKLTFDSYLYKTVVPVANLSCKLHYRQRRRESNLAAMPQRALNVRYH
jgi:hypothetical protein